MWTDIARHYQLNPDITDITGYSMGGGGTYRLGSQWPDLWGRAFPIVGPPSSAGSFANFRNIPVMAWYGQNDELVGPELSEQAFLNAEQAGIRYDQWVFTPAGHVTEGNNDEYAPAAAFFGEVTVDRNPRTSPTTTTRAPTTPSWVLRTTRTGCQGSPCATPAAPARSTSARSPAATATRPSSRCRSATTCCTAARTVRSPTRSARSAGAPRRSSRKPTSS